MCWTLFLIKLQAFRSVYPKSGTQEPKLAPSSIQFLFSFLWLKLRIAPFTEVRFKGALSGLRQFSAIGSPLKMMKNAFCFTLQALFVLKIFEFLSWLYGHVEEWIDSKNKVNFKFCDVTTWEINNCNTYIAQHLKR